MIDPSFILEQLLGPLAVAPNARGASAWMQAVQPELSLSQLQIFFKCLQRNFTWTNCCIMLHPAALYFVQYFVHVRFRSQIPSWKKDFTQQISFSQIHDKKWLVTQKEVTIVTVVATELQCDIVWYTTCSLLFEYEEFKYFERPRPRPEPSLWRWAGSGCESAVGCTSSLTEGVLSLVHRTVISDASHWIHVHILYMIFYGWIRVGYGFAV